MQIFVGKSLVFKVVLWAGLPSPGCSSNQLWSDYPFPLPSPTTNFCHHQPVDLRLPLRPLDPIVENDDEFGYSCERFPFIHSLLCFCFLSIHFLHWPFCIIFPPNKYPKNPMTFLPLKLRNKMVLKLSVDRRGRPHIGAICCFVFFLSSKLASFAFWY